MIIAILNILIPYFMGMIVTFLMFHPLREWKDGYETAKEHYNNWSLGFDEGFDSARKRFANYDEGFGDGFETGWNAALECHDREESE